MVLNTTGLVVLLAIGYLGINAIVQTADSVIGKIFGEHEKKRKE